MKTVLQYQNIQDLSRKIVKQATDQGASEAEVLAYARDDTVVRFSQNNISQSASLRDEGAVIRVFISPSKRAVVSVKQLGDPQAIDQGIKRAIYLAQNSGENKNARSFGSGQKIPRIGSNFKKGIDKITDEIASRGAKTAINTSLRGNKLIKRVAGTITARASEVTIQNSNGLDAYHKYSGASFVTVSLARKENSTGVGFASQASNNYGDLDFIAVSKEAADDAARSVKPKALPLAKYDVIFYPNAVFDWLGSFMQLGFSTQRMKGYVDVGKKCTSENVTIVDDPTDSSTLMAIPFDAEGTPSKKLPLIENGMAVSQCYDNNSAAKAGTQSTGHNMFPNDLTYESKFFPAWIYFPANQIVTPGKTSFEKMIEGSKKKTILVKRFMYGGLPMCVSETEVMQGYT
ncbi:MAG: TldD/PmbA family protein, partial [Nitrososphaerales archaeon]